MHIQGKITRYENFKVLFIHPDEYESIYIPAHIILEENSIEDYPIYNNYEQLQRLSPQPTEVYYSRKVDKEKLKQIYSGKITEVKKIFDLECKSEDVETYQFTQTENMEVDSYEYGLMGLISSGLERPPQKKPNFERLAFFVFLITLIIFVISRIFSQE